MATKEERTKRLLDIFNESQGLTEFRLIVRALKQNNIRLKHHYNRNAAPAYFQSGGVEQHIMINMAYSDEAIRIALDHEGTHATQDIQEKSTLRRSLHNIDMNSQLTLTLIGEAHAFSNQCEFAIKRYLDALEKGAATDSMEAKAFDGFFKKNGVEGRRYLKDYLSAMTGQDISLKRPSDVTNALGQYYYNSLMRGGNLNTAMKQGRKAVLKKFFEVEMFKNNPVLDSYIGRAVDHIKKYKQEYGQRSYKVSLAEIAAIHKTNGQPFLDINDYKDVLDIKDADALHIKSITFSAHKDDYLALTHQVRAYAKQSKGPFDFFSR